MKSEGFHKRVERLVQRVAQRGVILKKGAEAPELGEVGRVRQAPRVESVDVSQRPMDPETLKRERLRRAIVLGWSIALGLAATGAVVAAFVIWLRPILNREKDTSERDRLAYEARVKKASKYRSPTEDEALALVKRVLAVRTEEEVAELIRPGPTPPAAVIEGLAALRKADGEIVEEIWLGCIDKNGLQLEGVELRFDKTKESKNRLALLTPDGKGRWQMDYEAFVRRGDPPWDKLLEGGAGQGVVRAWIERERYYNGPFLDDKAWISYMVVSQDMDEELVGYCKKWSVQHRAMELMLKGVNRPTVRATLEIRRVAGAERRQFEILHVLAEDWVLAARPFDEMMTDAK